jgi:hypothetical protein
MGVEVNIRMELPVELAEHVSNEIGEFGEFDTIETYVRDLIRRDMEMIDAVTEANIDELRRAFATPSSECVTVTLEDVIERNHRRRA